MIAFFLQLLRSFRCRIDSVCCVVDTMIHSTCRWDRQGGAVFASMVDLSIGFVLRPNDCSVLPFVSRILAISRGVFMTFDARADNDF